MVDYIFKGVGLAFLAIIGGAVAIVLIPALIVALGDAAVAVAATSPMAAFAVVTGLMALYVGVIIYSFARS